MFERKVRDGVSRNPLDPSTIAFGQFQERPHRAPDLLRADPGGERLVDGPVVEVWQRHVAPPDRRIAVAHVRGDAPQQLLLAHDQATARCCAIARTGRVVTDSCADTRSLVSNSMCESSTSG